MDTDSKISITIWQCQGGFSSIIEVMNMEQNEVKRTVQVIGAAHIDVYGDYDKTVSEVIDKPGVVTFGVGGTAFNIACSLARQNVPVSLCTVVGDSTLTANVIYNACASLGIKTDCISSSPWVGEGAFLAHRVKGKLQSAVTSTTLTPISIPFEILVHGIEKASVVVADCNLSTEHLKNICTLTNRLSISLVIAGVSEKKVVRVKDMVVDGNTNCGNILVCNKHEWIVMAKSCNIDWRSFENSHNRNDAKRLCHINGCNRIIVTLGNDGLMIVSSSSDTIFRKAPDLDYIESSSGSGDAVVASVVDWMFRKKYFPNTDEDFSSFDDYIFRHVGPVLLSKTGNALNGLNILKTQINESTKTFGNRETLWSYPLMTLSQLARIIWFEDNLSSNKREKFKWWAKENLDLERVKGNQWRLRLDLLKNMFPDAFKRLVESKRKV